jgi:glycosyltransferase involved in cell wall biosynthesis
MYASVACGTPVIYAGVGPGREFANLPGLGTAIEYSTVEVARAMIVALGEPPLPEVRSEIAAWAVANVSLTAVAQRAVDAISGVLSTRRSPHN